MLPSSYTLLLTASFASGSGTSLWVPTTPQSPRPYALKKGQGITLPGGNTYPVTGNSSANAFCILNTHAAGRSNLNTSGLGLFPHVHQKTYENFYTSKGRVQLWGQNLAAYRANTSIQQTRVLGPGDGGAIPPGTIHTFSLLEPDTLLTGVLVPGGFEEFFFNFDGTFMNNGTSSGDDGLAKWDVYPEPGFLPRRDVVDGKAGPGNWYDGPNELPEGMGEPVWVAKNHGPKWLNSDGGRYQIVAPFVTGRQTGRMFSQGTVTVSPVDTDGGLDKKGLVVRSEVATAFVVEEGQLEVTVEGYEPVSLIDGDVVFVPGNTSFWYAAAAEFTKFMYVTGGGKGLDYDLMVGAQPWDSAFYPRQEGPRINRGMMGRI